MIVYRPQGTHIPRHFLYVQPAATPGCENSDWMDGEEPKLFTIEFVHGRAEVPDNLGRYMIDNGLARMSPILLPADDGLPRVR